MEGTDSIRELAPRWSLAGDEKLLGILQNTHQRIVSKCHEVNTKLDEMAKGLDSASINLQNVNNRFMALSNSQFIESRVYDDDADVTMETKPLEESPTPEVVDELVLLKRSLAVLDGAHEMAEILDSDTDDSDAQISVVLKPKDVYSHRPLPYIIGSQAWKSKWHAGLLVEDSDSDSVTSKPDIMDEYSESEDDVGSHRGRPAPDIAISETSSSFHSERDRDLVPEKKQTPADIAAELAARLGNAPPRVLEEPDDLPQSTPKVYMPHKPIPSNIFSDEPPPLDYQDQYSDDQEDDIFAEINKQSSGYNNKAQNRLEDDLFGKPVDNYEFQKEQRNIKQKPTFDDSEPDLFDKQNIIPKEVSRRRETEDSNKKPVGGISLFGSNKGTESIGAAILKRNQPKSFSSDESDDSGNIKNDAADDFEEAHNANYIFDNLFAKAKQAEQKAMKQRADKPEPEIPKAKVIEKPKVIKEKSKSKEETQKSQPKEVKDLFSDNIFDDIDDIFTSNIKIPTKEASKNAKSIFDDDDDDDLFSNIAKTPKDIVKDAKASGNKKSIFDSDDELFSDVKVTKDSKKNTVIEKPKEFKESESQMSIPVPAPKEKNNNTTKENEEKAIVNKTKSESAVKPKAKSKSIFDSDSDDDLFSDIKIKRSKSEKVESELFKKKETITPDTEKDLFKKKEAAIVTDALKAEKSKVFQSPSVFEEDEIDDLFINANKAKLANLSENDVDEHKIPEKIPVIVNENEFTEENLDLNNEKPKFNDENSPKLIKNVKPVIVNTKPYVFPKMYKSETSDQFKEALVEVSKDMSVNDSEASPNKLKISSINVDIDRESQETSKNTDVNTNNDENETILPKAQNLFSDTSKEIQESKINKDKIIENQDEKRTDEVIEKPDVTPEQKSQVPIATFDDIFTEPPAFEKIKEVKKTTNVNALFDDDSDDEALFFKKNDVISDEKPNVFSPSADFGIFDDEPPALVDFTSKSSKNDDIFHSINAKVINQSDTEWNEPNDEPIPKIFEDNLFSSPETSKADAKTEKSNIGSKEVDFKEDQSNINTNKPSSKPDVTKESIDQIDDVKKDKKIGKLDTKSFNINVQALVPGASPKKILKELNEDTKITNIDNTKEKDRTIDVEAIDTEPKTVKSISFDKPAGVLDNNLSKQRPRIQVKRRPSSRKARHEAVRKSVRDIDDDTDNSSSFDEPLPKLNQNKSIQKKQDVIAKEDTFSEDFNFVEPLPIRGESEESNKLTSEPKIDILSDNFDFLDDNKVKLDEEKYQDGVKASTVDELIQKSKDNQITDKLSDNKSNTLKKYDDILPKDNNDLFSTASNTFKKKEINEDVTTSLDELDINVKVYENEVIEESQSTTKVKYILNDEDIFSGKQKDDFLFNTTESDDELFKNKGIKTIGNTYKDTKISTEELNTTKSKTHTTRNSESSKTVQPKKESKSLFDLSDDEEDLFGKSTKTKKVDVKSKLFDSDSEEDLFSGKKKVKEETKKVKEVKAGGSLFGDDDNDLFGAKTKKTIASTKISASTSRFVTKDTKSTEVVFDDPLSMLDDD